MTYTREELSEKLLNWSNDINSSSGASIDADLLRSTAVELSRPLEVDVDVIANVINDNTYTVDGGPDAYVDGCEDAAKAVISAMHASAVDISSLKNRIKSLEELMSFRSGEDCVVHQLPNDPICCGAVVVEANRYRNSIRELSTLKAENKLLREAILSTCNLLNAFVNL